jgi:hypothetical protein
MASKRTKKSRTRATAKRPKRSRTAKKGRKRTPRRKTEPKRVVAKKQAAAPVELEEALAEPIADVSGVFRVSETLAHAQRGLDENDSLQFRDPSLVIEIERKRHETTQPISDEDIVSEEPDED